MDALLQTSNREINRLDIMQRIKDKLLTQIEAAQLLALSVRQVKGLYRAYKAEGVAGLISRRRGKPSHHRLDGETRQKALNLLFDRYADFGPTLAHEKLTEQHHLCISRESVRQLMIAEGLWKPRRAKRPPLYQMREQRSIQAGDLPNPISAPRLCPAPCPHHRLPETRRKRYHPLPKPAPGLYRLPETRSTNHYRGYQDPRPPKPNPTTSTANLLSRPLPRGLTKIAVCCPFWIYIGMPD